MEPKQIIYETDAQIVNRFYLTLDALRLEVIAFADRTDPSCLNLKLNGLYSSVNTATSHAARLQSDTEALKDAHSPSTRRESAQEVK